MARFAMSACVARAAAAAAALAVPTALCLSACGAHAANGAAVGAAPVSSAAAPSAAVATTPPTGTRPAASTAASGEALSSVALPPVPPLAPAPESKSTVASIRSDESWAACHRRFKAAAHDVSSDVAALARACEKPTKMKLLGKTLTGKQADRDRPQSLPFEARAGHCYRVYAQAEPGVRDLDVAVKDSAGVLVAHDAAHNGSSVVTDDGAVCFRQDDKASVVVSVGLGGGAYAVQIWED